MKSIIKSIHLLFYIMNILALISGCRFGDDFKSKQIDMDFSSFTGSDQYIQMIIERDQTLNVQNSDTKADFMILRDLQSCQGAWMCQDLQACVAGQCSTMCQTHDQCPQGNACTRASEMAEPRCGPCTYDDQCSSNEGCLEGVCVEKIKHVKINVNPQAWQQLRSDPYQRIRIPCSIQLVADSLSPQEHLFDPLDMSTNDGDILLNDPPYQCELSIHGGSSRDYRKHSLRIHLEQAQEQLGWGRKLTYRAEYNDKSYIRNQLSHWLFRRASQLPTPRTQYTWIQVNDDMMGLYLSVERVEAGYFSRWNRADDTLLFEADPPAAYSSLGISSLVKLDEYADYLIAYDLKLGYSWAPLIRWIEEDIHQDQLRWLEGNSEMPALRGSLFWKEYIDYIVLMSVIQNRDYVRKNYYFSLQKDQYGYKRWEVYPWDLDLSWGCIYDDNEGHTLCDELESDFPAVAGMLPQDTASSYPTDGFYNLLIHLALSQPVALTYFKQRTCSLLKSDIWQSEITRWQNAFLAQLSPWIERDTQDRINDIAEVQHAINEMNEFKQIRTMIMREYAECPTQ